MLRFGQISAKKLAKSPLAVGIVFVFFLPVLWAISSAITIVSYSLGLTNHLGASRGYVTSQKISDFFTLPLEKIDLSYGYGSKIIWVSEGTEIYVQYSAENFGDTPVAFTISDYALSPTRRQFVSARVEDAASGSLTHIAEDTGLYNIRIIPRRLISAREDVSYTFKMSWGARQPL